jgi:integrase
MSTYYDKDRKRWIFDFDKVIKGHRVRATKTLPEGWNRAKAEAYAKAETDRLYAIATGAAEERVLISTAVALYIKEVCPRLKNGDGVIAELARIHWAYDGRFMDELAEVAKEYKDGAVRELKDENGNMKAVPLSPASIRNKLSYLRAACRYAQKEHRLAKTADLNVSMPIVKNERHHYASRKEMLQIARAMTNRRARAALRVAFYSGMRLGEIVAVKVVDDAFLLEDTKNGERRMVPIHPRIRVCLRYFPLAIPKITVQRQFSNKSRALGLGHYHFHDMRHSAASHMINGGVDLYTVGGVLGHKDSRSTARYSHLAIESLAAAVAKIGTAGKKSPAPKEKAAEERPLKDI